MPTPPIEAAPAPAPPAPAEPSAAEPPDDGTPFSIAVYGSNPLPEGVLVVAHRNPSGGLVYVAADGGGRTFVPRGDGGTGATEVGR